MTSLNSDREPPQAGPAPGTSPAATSEPLHDVHSKQTAMDGDTKTLLGETDISSSQAAPILVGQKMGKYEIRARLGSGGMGAVYLAFDPLIEREVALKVLSADLCGSTSALQRFLGEARAIGRLNHPHVVSIYDIDQWNGQYFLIMELLSGGSVADLVDKVGPLPWEEACRMIAQAARGLAAAHQAGLVHRDIKPENLMLTKDHAVKVVDFGLSKLLDAAHDPKTAVTKAGQILGTPQYMSPEQFESAELDARTDVYSLGATLYRLLTAKFPFDECRTIIQVMTAHMTKPPPVPTAIDASIPRDLNRIIQRAMAKHPADRYQTGTEIALELESLLQGARASQAAEVPSRDADRAVRTVLILEPSKLQGAILKNACAQAGAQAVQILPRLDAGRQAVEQQVPDLFVTARQLPDGLGIDLARELCRQSRFQNSTVVLNSSDSSLTELASLGSAACLVLAPKTARPDEILRVVHAAGPNVMAGGPLPAPIDPAALRLQVVLDSGRIPDVLADVIRELRLLDVDIGVDSQGAALVHPPPDLILLLRRVDVPQHGEGFASLTQVTGESAPLTAAVHVDQGELFLRAVRRQGVVAICQRVLDAARLVCLFQGCRA